MGFYGRFILPRILDCAMKDKAASERRAALIPRATGAVLEIGIGSGLNLPYYTAAVTRLHGVDASPEMLAMARKKIGRAPFPVELTCDSAERLSLADGSVDTVVVTWTLCSIPDPLRALHEMRRVLKPGGRLLFVEHGASPDPNVLAWQRRLNPIWRRIGGGCHLDRAIDHLITTAGFRIEQMRNLYLKGPRPMTYTYEGAAAAGCTTTTR
ncbi:MAG TPA: class I SAM-dependent methyltransferase [Candidatus Polarisedimenticolia bacterium]|jgi:ubiquinone/menaquinone biosynthesis C-methylase UbiE|nr:class I SAM-dependent methyltransferase [Candidatus Polarisedimenticolia bacterium]